MINLEFHNDIDPKAFFPDAKHIIVYAFSFGNRHYFRFDDPINTPYHRALQCLVYYREYDMNVDRAILHAHTQAFDNVMSQSKITMAELLQLKQLNDQLKKRLELPKEPDLMYKLASVVYFDQTENPTMYEFKYGENKIRFWKKNATLKDFFLQKPFLELMPYLQYAGENLEQFSQMIQEQKEQHLDNLFPMLSELQRTILQGK